MAFHVMVTRRAKDLIIRGFWTDRTENIQEQHITPISGETAAETVELFMMENDMVASWPWSKRADSDMLQGEFVPSGSHKEIKDSKANEYDL